MRRVGIAALLVWIVLTLTFVLVRIAPGDPATLLVPPTASVTEVARVRDELGLDAPLVVQYARWARRVLRADWGESFVSRRPVSTVLGEAIAPTLLLGAISLVLSYVVGLAVGITQAACRGTRTDVALTVATTTVYAAPAYWLALALVAVFVVGAASWGFPHAARLPAFGMSAPGIPYTGAGAVLDIVRHAALPVTVLAAIGAAGVARYARASVSSVLSLDWVRTARAKGAAPPRIYGRHVLRNALPPIVVLFALSFPGIAAGSVFVEGVFAWPGLGRLMLSAIRSRDYPVVMGASALYATLVVFSNVAADLVLPLVDPRRRPT